MLGLGAGHHSNKREDWIRIGVARQNSCWPAKGKSSRGRKSQKELKAKKGFLQNEKLQQACKKQSTKASESVPASSGLYNLISGGNDTFQVPWEYISGEHERK